MLDTLPLEKPILIHKAGVIMQRNTPNYFKILEIEPTRDLKLIRAAYKKMLVAYHPDKGGDAEKAKEIMTAWENLNKPRTLEDCFQEYATNPGPRINVLHTEEKKFRAPAPAEGSAAAAALVTAGAKVTIFIPLRVSNRKQKPQNGDYGDDIGYPSIYRFYDPTSVDYNWIAAKLTHELSEYPVQVGVDPDEIGPILQQHSYYKRCLGAYAVGVEVLLSSLEPRQSEQERDPNSLSARSGQYFWLKRNTVINPLDIFLLNKAFMPVDGEKLLFDNATPDMVKPKIEEKPAPITPLVLSPKESILGRFLFNKKFWKERTVGLGSFPKGIENMQHSLLKYGSSLPELKTIAADRLKKDQLTEKAKPSIFNKKQEKSKSDRDTATSLFYQTVSEAKSIAEIETWIEKNYPQALSEVSLLGKK